jgi:hypothetical protein
MESLRLARPRADGRAAALPLRVRCWRSLSGAGICVIAAVMAWLEAWCSGATVIDAMEEMALAFPKVDDAKRKELAAAHAALGGKRHSHDRATRRIA